MKELLRSKLGKIVTRAALISILLVAFAWIIIGILMIVMDKTENHVNSIYEFFFSIAYFAIFAAIYLFAASVITFIVMIISKYRKYCFIGKVK